MFDLANFSESDMVEFGAILRRLGSAASSMEEVANNIVDHFFNYLVNKQTGEKACTLVRFYKTHPYSQLDSELQQFALNFLGGPPKSPTMTCLTLLATVGEKPEWNSRRNSVNHMAIPIPSENVVAQTPMISSLLNQFGVELNTLLKPDPTILVDLEQKKYNVFHVPEAVGSPYIPAQDDFVIPFGIRSVLGFGGMLFTGDLFVVILFSKVYIRRETAEIFKSLALNVKEAIVPFAGGTIFEQT